MSDFKSRKERILAQVSLRDLFQHQGWSYDTDHRIICLNPEHNDVHPDMKIYDDTNSVYCFACGFAGDVVRIVSHCILETQKYTDALDWLEGNFEVSENTTVAKLRLLKKLKSSSGPNLKNHAVLSILDLFKEVERAIPSPNLTLGACIKQYVLLDLYDEYGDDYVGWASTARSYIKGIYCKLIQTQFDTCTFDVEDIFPPELEALSRDEDYVWQL